MKISKATFVALFLLASAGLCGRILAGPYPGDLPDHGHTRSGDGGVLTNITINPSGKFAVGGATHTRSGFFVGASSITATQISVGASTMNPAGFFVGESSITASKIIVGISTMNAAGFFVGTSSITGTGVTTDNLTVTNGPTFGNLTIQTPSGPGNPSALNISNTNTSAQSDSVLTMSIRTGSQGANYQNFISSTSGMSWGLKAANDTFFVNPSSATGVFSDDGSASIRIYLTGARKGAVAIFGEPSANDATAGRYGERISSTTSRNAPTSTNYGDIATITLTPGDWNVSFNCNIDANSATVTRARCGIGDTIGNSASGLDEGVTAADIPLPVAGVRFGSGSIANWRVLTNTSVTYYLKMEATYTVATPIFRGQFNADRRR